MITQSINLNLIPGAVPPRIKVSQYDFGSRTLSFTLFNGTSPFTTASLAARIQGTKPDNKGFSYDATYSAGVVTADVTRQMTACAGAVICELVIVDGSNNELGTGNFILDVEAAALSEDTDISETEIPAIIDAAEANAERAEAAAESAEAASAHAPYIGENEHWYVWDTAQEQYVDSGVDAEGVDGVGIVSIAKTSTVGLVDTYTITLSNGNTSTFTVTNGAEATLPSGGTAGQALIKNSSTASDASWKDISTTGAIKWPQAEGSVKKNLLKYIWTSGTLKGLTVTVDNTGITISGQATSELAGGNPIAEIYLNKGTYTINGGQSGTPLPVSDFRVMYKIGESGTIVDFYDTDSTITISSDNTYVKVWVYVRNGYSIQNAIHIAPMIRLANIADSTYAPYVKDNNELDAEKIGWDDVSGDVQKNQIVYPYVFSQDSLSGVTFTVMSDGTIKLNNTANAGINKAIHFRSGYSEGTMVDNYPVVLKAGSYIVSKGQNENVSIRINKTVSGSASTIVVLAANEESASFTISEDTQIGILLDIASGASFSNTIIHPMIRKASVQDPTYVPYVPSNAELANMIKSATFSGTTSASGNVVISATKQIKVLSAFCDTIVDDSSVFAVPVYLSATSTALHLMKAVGGAAVASKEVSGTYYYID